MRIAFLVTVLLHGLIHLLGFVKGFGLKEVKELTQPISKPIALWWLLATAFFFLYAFLFYGNNKYAWLIGMLAVIISQLLIVLFWKDAKFGTIPNLIIGAITLVSLGGYLIESEFTKKVKYDFIENNHLSTDILTINDMAHLPAIVQQYLHYTQSVGQPKVKNFKAEFVGRMRGKPSDNYMKLHSVQYNFYQKPSRYFFMQASKMGLPATGLHCYSNVTATFEVKMLNWLKVVNAKGEKLNRAETVTLFNDMCFIAPATLIDKRITWETMNDTTVKGTYKNENITISALLYFNQKGALMNFISNDRYETDGKQYHNYPWATPVTDYQMLNGYFLPGKAKLIYQKPEGDFTYGELEYKSVQYNLSEL
jgi:hypothetical protein